MSFFHCGIVKLIFWVIFGDFLKMNFPPFVQVESAKRAKRWKNGFKNSKKSLKIVNVN